MNPAAADSPRPVRVRRRIVDVANIDRVRDGRQRPVTDPPSHEPPTPSVIDRARADSPTHRESWCLVLGHGRSTAFPFRRAWCASPSARGTRTHSAAGLLRRPRGSPHRASRVRHRVHDRIRHRGLVAGPPRRGSARTGRRWPTTSGGSVAAVDLPVDRGCRHRVRQSDQRHPYGADLRAGREWPVCTSKIRCCPRSADTWKARQVDSDRADMESKIRAAVDATIQYRPGPDRPD